MKNNLKVVDYLFAILLIALLASIAIFVDNSLLTLLLTISIIVAFFYFLILKRNILSIIDLNSVQTSNKLDQVIVEISFLKTKLENFENTISENGENHLNMISESMISMQTEIELLENQLITFSQNQKEDLDSVTVRLEKGRTNQSVNLNKKIRVAKESVINTLNGSLISFIENFEEYKFHINEKL